MSRRLSKCAKINISLEGGGFERVKIITIFLLLDKSVGPRMSDSDTELLIDHDVNSNGSLGQAPSTQRTLNTFFGVIVPCCLSMFSVVLFLRMGFIIGQAGLIQALIMLVIGKE